jgi:hypothetical protein
VFRGDEQDAALTEAQRGNVAVAHLWERGPPSSCASTLESSESKCIN